MDITTVGELVLGQGELRGHYVHSLSVVSTSITGRLVTASHSTQEDSPRMTTVFKVVDGEVECLGTGTELVIYGPVHNA